jgi:hypothetical protein
MDYNINFIFNLLMLFAVLYIAFLKSYSNEKGKNLATKEDIGEITKEVENVKQFFNESLEKLKSDLNLSTQIRFSLKSAEIEALLNLYEKYFVWFNSMRSFNAPSLREPFHKEISRIIDRSYLDFLMADSKADLFIKSKEILALKSTLKLSTLVLEKEILFFLANLELHCFNYKQLDNIDNLKERVNKHKEVNDEYLKSVTEFNSNKLSHIRDISKISEPFKELLLKELNKLAE